MAVVMDGSVHLPVAPERVWDLWVDAARYPQWQAALLAVRELSGRLDAEGATCLLDHGPKLKRRLRVMVAERPTRHVIEQTGIGVQDLTTATFEPEKHGTRLTVVTHMHLNPLMQVLSRFDRRSRIRREFQAELERFARFVTRRPAQVQVGGVYVVDAGAFRRRVTVIGQQGDRVHVRVHPGHLRGRDADEALPVAPKPLAAHANLYPISPPIRGGGTLPSAGVPFLLRDGGHGIQHLALAVDAWTDSRARPVAEEPVTADDRAAVSSWQVVNRPTVGLDLDLDLAPVWTLRLSSGEPEVWGAAKTLKAELTRVHVALWADRWPKRPADVRPWSLSVRGISEEEFLSGAFLTGRPFSIGHLPVTRAAFIDADPGFAGVWTLEPVEVEGYESWKEAGGGTFTTLEHVVSTQWGAPTAPR